MPRGRVGWDGWEVEKYIGKCLIKADENIIGEYVIPDGTISIGQSRGSGY